MGLGPRPHLPGGRCARLVPGERYGEGGSRYCLARDTFANEQGSYCEVNGKKKDTLLYFYGTRG